MAVNSLDHLPNELLLLIFIRGFDPGPDQGPPCFRKPKDLALNARGVNRRWKLLVDFLSRTTQDAWIARLLLAMPVSDSDVHSNNRNLVRVLMQFRRQLLTSNGCDLAITFSIPFRTSWTKSYTDPATQAPSTRVRLLLHTMESLLPYACQITSLHLQGSQPHSAYQLLSLLSSRWPVTAKRLVDVSITQGWILDGVPQPISELAKLSGIDVFKGILHDTNLSPTPPITFVSLHSLKYLELPGCSWLVEAFYLPTTLKHLKITSVDGSSLPILHTFLVERADLQRHLLSLVIGKPYIGYGIPPAKQEPNIWDASRPVMSLPMLTTLSLHAPMGGHMAKLIKLLVLPSLEELSLSILQDVPPGTNEPGSNHTMGSERDEDKLETESNLVPNKLKDSRLQKATIFLNLAYGLPSCLSFISNVPITHMRLGARDWIDKSSQSDTYVSLLARALSNIRPRSLELDDISYRGIHFVLRSLDMSLLQDLSVRVNPEGGRNIPYAENAHPSFQPDESIPLPHLKRLTWSGWEGFAGHLISHIDAECLDHLILSVTNLEGDKFNDGDFIEWKGKLTSGDPNPLPSVRTVEYELSVPKLPVHPTTWPFSGVEALKLHLKLRMYTGLDALGIKKCEDALCELLNELNPKLGETSYVPFNQARSLTISFQLTCYYHFDDPDPEDVVTPQATQPRINEDVLRSAISALMAHRRRSGAVYLVLDKFRQRLDWEETVARPRRLTLQLEIEATAQPD